MQPNFRLFPGQMESCGFIVQVSVQFAMNQENYSGVIWVMGHKIIKSENYSRLLFQYKYGFRLVCVHIYILYISNGYNFRIKNVGSSLIPYRQRNKFLFCWMECEIMSVIFRFALYTTVLSVVSRANCLKVANL